MKFPEFIPWFVGISISICLSWWALHPTPDYSPTSPALALPRPVEDAERQVLTEQASQLNRWIGQARQKTGGPIPLLEVESQLPRPIFDNPLIDGVGGLQESCPTTALDHPGLDWIYCPQSGVFLPNIPD
jgi:hypothetical protein